MKLAHLALWTQDLEAAAAFWKSYFDAEIGDRYESRNRRGFASRFVQIRGIEARIEIMEGPWVTPHPGETSGWAHIALSVGSKSQVDTFADLFRHDGLLVSEPRKTGDGYYEAVVRSPEGTLIEIVE
ncbi:VOC family protein [Palleronia caenipelagi]|uniref:Glyoxalase/bleomycin resistance/extradiol dioxygenase family protein n=1 Tax=Palleronia caenipelagi TaxID=2489174 RepID=A0A547PN63_9RHOB|nr:VOC family protein [Palleronia caenipelagi]TRD15569.1 glyoxalase/bleomycin resistance/extradiol dioxygenase family protein [Palleronia caenipelagi]